MSFEYSSVAELFRTVGLLPNAIPAKNPVPVLACFAVGSPSCPWSSSSLVISDSSITGSGVGEIGEAKLSANHCLIRSTSSCGDGKMTRELLYRLSRKVEISYSLKF